MSTPETPSRTAAIQQYIQDVASGASPHCYGALRLAFGNTMNVKKYKRQKIAVEPKAEGVHVAANTDVDLAMGMWESVD